MYIKIKEMKGKNMNEFIEKNKSMLVLFYFLTKFFGAVLTIVGFIVVFVQSIALISRIGDFDLFMNFFGNLPWGVISFLPTGYLLLALAQFIRYLFDNEYKPGWILGNAVQFMYLYAIVLAIVLTVFCIMECSQHLDKKYEILYHGLSYVFYGGGKVIILIGLGKVLKRIMPVIEESKTLI